MHLSVDVVQANATGRETGIGESNNTNSLGRIVDRRSREYSHPI